MTEFNTRFRELRKTLGITLREMSQVLDIPLSTVSKYEQGIIKPGVEILSKVSTRYNVNLNWLLTGVGEMFIENKDNLLGASIDDFVRLKAVKADDYIKVHSTLDETTEDNYDNRQIIGDDYEKSMFEIASRSNRPVIVELLNNDSDSISIFYPNEKSETIDKKELSKRDKLLKMTKSKLDNLYTDRKKLEFVDTAIKALEDKKSFKELKLLLKGIEISLK